MADVLNQVPGLAGYLAMQNQRQRAAMGDLQGVSGLMSVLRQQQEAERAAQMAPLQMDALRAQVQERNLAAQMAQRKQAFFSPENMQQFMTGGQPAVAPGQGVTGGMDEGGLGQILGVGPTEQGAPAAQSGVAPRLDIDRLIAGGVSQGVLNPEAMIARQSQIENQRSNLILRQQQLLDKRAAEEREARNDAERNAARARYEQGVLDLRRDMVEARRSGAGGGSGDARREPMRVSVNGQNVQAWRDRVGNVYGQDGRVIQNYGPEISSSDQTAEQKRVADGETLASLNDMLNRAERIVSSNPGTVTGVAGAVRSSVNILANQLGGNAMGGSVSPAQSLRQLRDSMLSATGTMGRLSNQDRQRLEDIWDLGLLGSPAKINEAINLTRQIVNSRYAGSSVPTARGTPGAPSAPATSPNATDEALVQKYLNPGR